MKLKAIYPRGGDRIEVAIEHEGIGYTFARDLKLDWSAVDACYPIRDEKANAAWTAAMAALVEKHRAEVEAWATPLVAAQVAAAADAKTAADALAVAEERKAKILSYVAEHEKDADVASVLTKAVPVVVAPKEIVR